MLDHRSPRHLPCRQTTSNHHLCLVSPLRSGNVSSKPEGSRRRVAASPGAAQTAVQASSRLSRTLFSTAPPELSRSAPLRMIDCAMKDASQIDCAASLISHWGPFRRPLLAACLEPPMWYFLPLIGVMETANGGHHKAMPPPGRAQALGAGTCECAPSLPHPIEPRPTGARGRAG